MANAERRIPDTQRRKQDVEIVYEDDFLLVAAKPQGMCVHPAPGVRSETLVEWLRQYYECKRNPKAHISAVSRLDRGTSGLILVVTDPAAHPVLHKQVLSRAIRREYQCLVWGRPLFQETQVDIPLSRQEAERRMAAYDVSARDASLWGARPAITNFRVLQDYGDSALLNASLETGRMHQIRVHCQFMRHPIVGDPSYGLLRNQFTITGDWSSPNRTRANSSHEPSVGRRRSVEADLEFQCLHAGHLLFQHPITGERMEFHQPVPESFRLAERALATGMVY